MSLFRRSALAAGFVALYSIGGFTPAAAAGYTSLTVFGDSLSDVGNLAAATGAATGGAVRIPVSPPYSGGRFSNGPVWVEPFAQALGLGPVAPSLLGGRDFAIGLATATGTASFTLPAPPLPAPVTVTVPGLPQQVAAFLGTSPAIGSGDLFAVWAGANNLLGGLGALASPTPPANPVAFLTGLARNAADAVAGQVGVLADAGARNILVLNLPDLGRIPRTSGSPTASALATAASAAFNAQLASGLAAAGARPGLRLMTLDAFALINDAVANPSAQGLTNVTTQCLAGSSPTIYFGAAVQVCTPVQLATSLFWDDVHPTAAGHALLAQAAVAAVPAPGAALVLLAGLAGLVLVRARRQTL